MTTTEKAMGQPREQAVGAQAGTKPSPIQENKQRPDIATLRLWIQSLFFTYTIWLGFRFHGFYSWAIGTSQAMFSRPPGVEGFLPISALLSLKRLLLTGVFDTIHPAGLVIFLAALTIGFLFRKGFCGWICPVGALSNLAERLLRPIHKKIPPFPRWLAWPLLSLKYLLLAFFLYVILWKMDLHAVEAFQRTPYNLAADAKMLLFFLSPSPLAGTITLVIILLSLVFKNFWCRYLCPYGALLGLVGTCGPMAVHRDPEKCIHCGKCDRICPGAISISSKQQIRLNECVGCMECVNVCPRKDCLSMQLAGGFRIGRYLIPAAVVGTFLLFFAVALATGHWQSSLPTATLQKMYKISATLGHPGTL